MHHPIRTSTALEDIQKTIRIGRRTQKGHLRVELTKEADSAAVCRRIQEVLGEKGSARVLTEMTELIIRNVDHLSGESDVKEALNGALNRDVSVAYINLWERPDATKRARVRLPRSEAEVITQSSRLLMKYSACSLDIVQRQDMAKRRCFRCLEWGHQARDCQGVDRSNICIRCGTQGHRAANCTNSVKCIRCGGPHHIGSKQCVSTSSP